MSSDTTILLDVYQRLGSIEAKLDNMTKTHDDLEKKVEELTGIKQKFGGIIITLSLFWSLICAGFAFYADNIRGLFHK